MKADEYKVMQQAIQVGVGFGLRRAYKHEETSPSEEELERIAPYVEDAVSNEICEWFTFPEKEVECSCEGRAN